MSVASFSAVLIAGMASVIFALTGGRGKLVYIDEDHGLHFQCQPDCRYACSNLTVSELFVSFGLLAGLLRVPTFVLLFRKQIRRSS